MGTITVTEIYTFAYVDLPETKKAICGNCKETLLIPEKKEDRPTRCPFCNAYFLEIAQHN